MASVSGEPPIPSPYGRIPHRKPNSSPEQSDHSDIVNQSIFDRVAAIYSQGGDGSENEGQEMEGDNIVGSELLERIARIISQNEAQTSSPSPAQEGMKIKIMVHYKD